MIPDPRRSSLPTFIAVTLLTLFPANGWGEEPDRATYFDEVEVVGDREPSKVGRTTIDGQELSRIPGAGGDPLRAAIALPGVTTGSDVSANPAVRGSGPQDNQSFVDRIPLSYLFHMGGMTGVLPADMVERFTLYAAAFGPEFGDATGAVFDVVLRDPKEDRLHTSLSASMLEADLLMEGPVGKNGGIAASLRRSYIDLFLPKSGDAGKGVTYRQFPQYSDYLVKGVYRLTDDHTFSLLIDGARDEMKLDITEEAPFAAHDPVLAGSFALSQEFHQQGGTVTSHLGEATNRLTLSHATHDIDQRLENLGHALVTVESRRLRERFDLPLGDRHRVTVGADVTASTVDLDLDLPRKLPNDYEADVDFTTSPRARYRGSIEGMGYALFVKDRWEVIDRLTLVLGGRYEYGDYLDQADLMPRLGVEWNVTDRTLLMAGWGTYRQDPQGFEMIDAFGNPNLVRTEAIHTVIGAEQTFDDGWTVKGELYNKAFDRLVTPDKELRYVNGGSGNARGGELLVKRDGELWSGWLSVAYAKTQRRNDVTGERFDYAYDQPLIVNAVGSWTFAERWSAGFRWRYQSGAPTTPVTGTYVADDGRVRPVYGPLGSERLPDYHRLDLRIDRTTEHESWTMVWFLEVINAYGRKNVSGYSYNVDYSEREPVNQLPMFPSFGVSARF